MIARYLCDGCASTLEFTDLGNMHLNTPTPRFCPLCGHDGIRRIKSFADWQSAACIQALRADPRLVQLLYVEWRGEPKGHTTYISYLRWRLG